MLTHVDPITYENVGRTAPPDQDIWFGTDAVQDSYQWTINGVPYITEAGGDYALWNDGCFIFKEEVSGDFFSVNCTDTELLDAGLVVPSEEVASTVNETTPSDDTVPLVGSDTETDSEPEAEVTPTDLPNDVAGVTVAPVPGESDEVLEEVLGLSDSNNNDLGNTESIVMETTTQPEVLGASAGSNLAQTGLSVYMYSFVAVVILASVLLVMRFRPSLVKVKNFR